MYYGKLGEKIMLMCGFKFLNRQGSNENCVMAVTNFIIYSTAYHISTTKTTLHKRKCLYLHRYKLKHELLMYMYLRALMIFASSYDGSTVRPRLSGRVRTGTHPYK